MMLQKTPGVTLVNCLQIYKFDNWYWQIFYFDSIPNKYYGQVNLEESAELGQNLDLRQIYFIMRKRKIKLKPIKVTQ